MLSLLHLLRWTARYSFEHKEIVVDDLMSILFIVEKNFKNISVITNQMPNDENFYFECY